MQTPGLAESLDNTAPLHLSQIPVPVLSTSADKHRFVCHICGATTNSLCVPFKNLWSLKCMYGLMDQPCPIRRCRMIHLQKKMITPHHTKDPDRRTTCRRINRNPSPITTSHQTVVIPFINSRCIMPPTPFFLPVCGINTILSEPATLPCIADGVMACFCAPKDYTLAMHLVTIRPKNPPPPPGHRLPCRTPRRNVRSGRHFICFPWPVESCSDPHLLFLFLFFSLLLSLLLLIITFLFSFFSKIHPPTPPPLSSFALYLSPPLTLCILPIPT